MSDMMDESHIVEYESILGKLEKVVYVLKHRAEIDEFGVVVHAEAYYDGEDKLIDWRRIRRLEKISKSSYVRKMHHMGMRLMGAKRVKNPKAKQPSIIDYHW